jgi:hypothetical protein
MHLQSFECTLKACNIGINDSSKTEGRHDSSDDSWRKRLVGDLIGFL